MKVADLAETLRSFEATVKAAQDSAKAELRQEMGSVKKALDEKVGGAMAMLDTKIVGLLATARAEVAVAMVVVKDYGASATGRCRFGGASSAHQGAQGPVEGRQGGKEIAAYATGPFPFHPFFC